MTLIFSIISTNTSSRFFPPGSLATTDLVTAVPGNRCDPCWQQSPLLYQKQSCSTINYSTHANPQSCGHPKSRFVLGTPVPNLFCYVLLSSPNKGKRIRECGSLALVTISLISDSLLGTSFQGSSQWSMLLHSIKLGRAVKQICATRVLPYLCFNWVKMEHKGWSFTMKRAAGPSDGIRAASTTTGSLNTNDFNASVDVVWGYPKSCTRR